MKAVSSFVLFTMTSMVLFFSVAGWAQADTITFGEVDLDRLDLAGPQIEGDFTYSATTGDGWELQTVFSVEGAALVTKFNGEDSNIGDTVEFRRTDSGLFTFDSVDFSTILNADSDNVLFSGFLDGNLVDTLALDFSNGGSFITVPANFSGLLDLLTLEVTFTDNNAAIFDNLVLTPVVIPEPGTSCVLLACIASVCGWRRQRVAVRRN